MPAPIVLNGQISQQASRQQLVAAGKMFAVTNPTPGTAIANATLTGYSATANGLFVISNGNPSGGASIYLDRLQLVQTATAPTGTLVKRFEVISETGIVAGSGNVATRTPLNMNPSFPNTTGATVQGFNAGAITIPAAVGTRRQLQVLAMPTGVTVVHDTFVVDFGGEVLSVKNGGAAARATDAALIAISAAPVCIAPQTSAWINMWWVTQAVNVPSYEFTLTYSEL